MQNIATAGTADIDRPYERCLHLGPQALTDAQLLSVILRTGGPGKPVEELAKEVLAAAPRQEGLLALCHFSAEELMRIAGIGKVKAVQLLCIGELSRRIAARRLAPGLSFKDSETIAAYYMETLRHEEQERLIGVFLDTKLRRISDEVLFVGTVDRSVADPREIFLAALRHRAVCLVLLHNHPSGDPSPSEEDIRMTRRTAEAGEIIGIPLLDHIIIGDGVYTSLRSQGILEDDG